MGCNQNGQEETHRRGRRQGGRAILNRHPLVRGQGAPSFFFASEFLPDLRGSPHSPPSRGGEKGEGVLSPLLFQTLAADKRIPPALVTLPFRICHSGRQPEPLYSVTPEKVRILQSRHPGESRGPESLIRSLSEKDWIPAQRIRRDDDRRKERGEGPPLSLSPKRNACLMGMHDEEEGSP